MSSGGAKMDMNFINIGFLLSFTTGQPTTDRAGNTVEKSHAAYSSLIVDPILDGLNPDASKASYA